MAPAKVNLGLRVLYKRTDGYHEIQSIMVPLSLHDILRVQLCDDGIHLQCSDNSLPGGETNLVYKAARCILDYCSLKNGVQVELTKYIPVGAGLGGGSSDAAATLLGVNELLGCPCSGEELHHLAVRLGADVPFFLLGSAALAEGIGERLTPLPFFPRLWTLVVYPNFRVSSRWAYENLTLTTGANRSKVYNSIDLFSRAMSGWLAGDVEEDQLDVEKWPLALQNDFEPLIFRSFPQLSKIKQQLRRAGARVVTMTGSGPTLLGLFSSRQEANCARERLSLEGAARIYLVHTCAVKR
ncbi:MAG: 4-(cytidine 5'-diphospho)-2-C-methyl-D-erythritol kinase [Deltaproteobacteria bacterium]|nr:4-(cytidine 5'-diphospho)-2-C-methyl-D-erythritol kinase [Deltaproteobacteria bacterium]